MSRKVQAATGRRGLGLPNGRVIHSGDTSVLTDAQWPLVAALVTSGDLVDLGATTDPPDATPTGVRITSESDPVATAALVAYEALAASTFVPEWKPLTHYTAGFAVLNPTGDVVTAKVDFTSGASYSAANWNLSPNYQTTAGLDTASALLVTTPGTATDVALRGRYAKVISVPPSGDTTGATDYANLTAAIATAMASPQTPIAIAGKYYVNAPLILKPGNSGTGNVPQQVPSIITSTGAGHIGDEPDFSATSIKAVGSFPVGSFLIDYQQNGTPYGSTGAVVKGFTLECNSLAAGFRAQGPREFKVSGLTIVAPVAPVSPGDSANGGFSISTIASGANAPAYNVFEHITVWINSASTGDCFWDATNAENTYISCRALAPAGGASYHVATESGGGQACNTYIDCHYASGMYGVIMDSASSAKFFGLSLFNNSPWPSKNALLLKNGWQYNQPAFYPPRFTACDFINNPSSGVSEADGAVVRFATGPAYNIDAMFTACYFGAPGAFTSDWVYSDAGITQGGIVQFTDCIFNGTPAVQKVNDQSNLARFNNCKGINDKSTRFTFSTTLEVAVSAALTMTSADVGLNHACTVTSAAYTVTLPTPVGIAGSIIGVRVTPSSTKLLTVATAAGNIDGQVTRIMWAGESAMLESDGTNWVKIAGRSLPMSATYLATAATPIPTSTVTTIPFNSVGRDNTGLMASGSNIVIQRPGLYTVQSRASMSACPTGGASRCILIAQKNGTTAVVQNETGVVAGTNLAFVATDQITLAAADTLLMQFYQNSISSWSTVASGVANGSAMTVTEIPAW